MVNNFYNTSTQNSFSQLRPFRVGYWGQIEFEKVNKFEKNFMLLIRFRNRGILINSNETGLQTPTYLLENYKLLISTCLRSHFETNTNPFEDEYDSEGYLDLVSYILRAHRDNYSTVTNTSNYIR